MTLRRAVVLTASAVALTAGFWSVRWWYRATHPVVPLDTPAAWVPRVVVAAGHRTPLDAPFGVAAAADGTLYVAESGDRPAIRRVQTDGEVVLVAGGRRGFADGHGASAAFNTPSHLSLAADGALFVADTGNHAIRRVSPDGEVTTIAGNGHAGSGEGADAQLNGPVGVAAMPNGHVLVADTYNDRVVELIPPGGQTRAWRMTLLAGNGMPGMADGAAAGAAFDTPSAVAVLDDGSAIVADTGNDALRHVLADGTVTTVSSIDRAGSAGALWRPLGVAPGSKGRIYVTDSRARVLEIVPGADRRVMAGAQAGFAEGIGTAARFRDPAGIAVTSDGRLAVADSANGLLRVLDLPERLGSWAPAPPGLSPGFNLARFASLPLVWPVDPQEGPHEIAGTIGEPRGNPGGSGRDRFHAGVDVRADEGTLVRAVRDGVVSSVLPTGATGTLSEYLAVDPITYVHLRAGRDRRDVPVGEWVTVLPDPVTGKPARVRIRRGTRVPAGEVIGTVNRFRHVHLNIGPAGEEGNALLVGLPGAVDTVPPVVSSITLTDLDGRPLVEKVKGRVVVTGPVRIIVEAYDRMDDSPPRRRLGLFQTGYQVVTADGSVMPQFAQPHIAVTFDRLPTAPAAPPSLYAAGSGIPFYGTRVTRFRYLVTTHIADGAVVEDPWVPSVAPGNYAIRAFAADAFGNVTTAARDLPIVVVRP